MSIFAVTEILVRFTSSNFEIAEDASSLDVYFEVVREVSPGMYVPAEYTFDFQLQVTTVTVVGSATGECSEILTPVLQLSIVYIHCLYEVRIYSLRLL